MGNQTSVTLPTGAVVTNEFNATNGNLLAIRAGTNLITSFSYDAAGNVTAEGDVFGMNRFAYDALGNAKWMTNTLGRLTTSDYDANGNLTNLVDDSGTSSVRYDGQNRETVSDYSHGITLTNTYESHLDWNSVNGPTIGHMERRFDGPGRLAGWTTANGAKPGFAYTANGQLEYETNSIGVVTCYTYDAAGRVIAATNLATGAGTTYGYDLAGRRIAETNALNGFSLFAYNPDGSLAVMTNSFLTNYWRYTYSVGGACCGGSGGGSTTVIDPLSRHTEEVRSPHGLPLQTIHRLTLGPFESYAATNSITYLSGLVSPDQEAEDYPATITDEGGRTRQFGYSAFGQLERATDLGGTW
jgi:YD repeat-containing protein